jgi:class 3 adenylate cyclase
MTLSTDVRSVLPLVRVPTLVVHSEADPYVRADHGGYIADAIFGARFVALPGDGHILPSVDLDALVSEVEEVVTGARGASEPERGLATLVFTDIVASTEKAATIGDTAWREVLDSHDELARRYLEVFGGQLVKTMGDGLIATFDGPARAIRFAVALRDELQRRDIEIRVGIHAGEVERRNDDVGGIAVHIAARVQAAASAGEIVVSRTVTDLVAGSSLEFDDLGEHELKGIAQPWHLYRLAR